MAEWLKAHAWKACKPKGFEGSNPFLSANEVAPFLGLFLLVEWKGEKPSGFEKIVRNDFSRLVFQRGARRVRYMDVPDNPFLSAKYKAEKSTPTTAYSLLKQLSIYQK